MKYRIKARETWVVIYEIEADDEAEALCAWMVDAAGVEISEELIDTTRLTEPTPHPKRR